MTRKEFVKFVQNHKTNHLKKSVVSDKSVTDPSFYRTGRQLIFEPLNIEYRMKYPDGIPLDKDNPHNFKEYDKLYPDNFKAIQQANIDIQDTKSKLHSITKQQQQQQQQPNN